MPANFDDYKIPFLVTLIILLVATVLLIISTIILIVWVRKLSRKIDENDPFKGRFRLARPKTIDGRFKDEVIPKPKYDTSNGLEKSKKPNKYQNNSFVTDELENIVFAEDFDSRRKPDTTFSNQNFTYPGQGNMRNQNFLSRPQEAWRKEKGNNNFMGSDVNFY